MTTSVVTGEALATTAGSNVGDVLRSVPGVNVIQLSARDVQVTSRQAMGCEKRGPGMRWRSPPDYCLGSRRMVSAGSVGEPGWSSAIL